MLWNVFYWTVASVLYTLLALLAVWVLKELIMGINHSDKNLEGRVAIVTGGSSGIGLETVKDLARRGAEVVFTSRDLNKGEKIASIIRQETRNSKVRVVTLDLASQSDVRRFAKEIKDKYPKIHYLVNNAGLVGDIGKDFRGIKETRKDTVDGFELTMASNFLGHFTLTELLLPNLKEGAKDMSDKARIVHVSSTGNIKANLEVDNFDLNARKREFGSFQQYCNSKLAQIMHSNELARRLRGDNIESVSLHPGGVRTDILRYTEDGLMHFLFHGSAWLLGKNCWQGAQTTLYALLTDDDVNGKYLADCRADWFTHKLVGNVAAEEKLYKEVHKLLGFTL